MSINGSYSSNITLNGSAMWYGLNDYLYNGAVFVKGTGAYQGDLAALLSNTQLAYLNAVQGWSALQVFSGGIWATGGITFVDGGTASSVLQQGGRNLALQNLDNSVARYFYISNKAGNGVVSVNMETGDAGFGVVNAVGGLQVNAHNVLPSTLTGYHGTSGTKVQLSDGTGTSGLVKFATDGSLITASASDVPTITPSQAGLSNVTNDAQTKAAIVPNTAPSAGQVLAGNAGGTAYAPVTVSGDGSMSSTGVLTVGSVNGVSHPASPSVHAVAVVTATNTASGGSPCRGRDSE